MTMPISEANTVYGKIGIKVWIFKGEIFGKRDLSPNIGNTREAIWATGVSATGQREKEDRILATIQCYNRKELNIRKKQKGRVKGIAQRGHTIAFGSFGLKALEPGWITSRQLEAARIAVTRAMKREGQVWIRCFQTNQ